MTLIDAASRRGALRGDGAGGRKLGRLRRQHDGRHRFARRHAAAISARCATIARATCSATTSPRSACASTRRPRPRSRHRALPDPGHAGRAAHDGTYLGACVELGPEDIDAELIGSAPGHLSRRLSVRPAARPRRRSARRRDRARGRPAGGADALRPVLRRPAPRRVPRAGRAARSTSCSPTRPRSARFTRPAISRRRAAAVRAMSGSPC